MIFLFFFFVVLAMLTSLLFCLLEDICFWFLFVCLFFYLGGGVQDYFIISGVANIRALTVTKQFSFNNKHISEKDITRVIRKWWKRYVFVLFVIQCHKHELYNPRWNDCYQTDHCLQKVRNMLTNHQHQGRFVPQ